LARTPEIICRICRTRTPSRLLEPIWSSSPPLSLADQRLGDDGAAAADVFHELGVSFTFFAAAAESGNT
jgi:hypothetical protein